MMKKVLYAVVGILCSSLLFIGTVNAEVTKTNFAETVQEEIDTFGSSDSYADYITTLKSVDLSDYTESSDKINVYIFRGKTCGYCLKAVSFFASIEKEYGKYFNLVTYEVWNNSDNSDLMTQVSGVLGDTVSGVPYIVIGNKSYTGYSSDMDSEIEAKIKEVYNSTDRYDVMDHLSDTTTSNDDTTTTTKTSNTAVVWLSIVDVVMVFGLVIYINYKNNKTKTYIDEQINKIAHEAKKAKK